MTGKRLLRVLVVTLIGVLVSCTGGTEDTPEPRPSPIAENSNLDYLVNIDESPDIRVSGSEFEFATDNCGARASALESFSRSREFTVMLNAAVSESLRGQLGGEFVLSELELAVGSRFGVEVGSTETVRTERQIETPPDSRTVVRLQWEEIWQTGNISIVDTDENEIGNVPFRLLTTMRLSQTGIQDMPCGTMTPTPNNPTAESGTAESAATRLPPTETPTPTWTPTPTDTPMPTETPTPTPTPSPTITPVPSISLPFVDNFDNGRRPEWEVLEGDPVTTEEGLKPLEDRLSVQVGENLSNIVVEFDYALTHYLFDAFNDAPQVTITFGNVARFRLDSDDVSSWQAFSNGKWTTVATGNGEVRKNGGRARLVISGNSYEAYIDGSPYASASFGDAASGPVHVRILKGGSIDNFEVQAQ